MRLCLVLLTVSLMSSLQADQAGRALRDLDPTRLTDLAAKGSQQVAAMLELSRREFEQGRLDDAEGWLWKAVQAIPNSGAAGRTAPPTATRLASGVIPVQAPRARSTPLPVYPADLRALGVGGLVQVAFTIDARGRAGTVIARAASGLRDLGALALDAVRSWEFEPVEIDGRPVPVSLIMWMDFSPADGVVAILGGAPEQVAGYYGVAVELLAAGNNLKAFEALAHVMALLQDERRYPGTMIAHPTAAGTDLRTIDPVLFAPVRLDSAMPGYPDIARRAGIDGVVELSVVVGADGKVREAYGVDGPERLVDASLASVQTWRYTPGLIGGMPAPYHVKVALRFARDGFGNGRVTDATGESDVEAPRKIHDVPPEYPSAAQAKKLAGVVVIEAVVNQNGEVTGATVKTSVAPLLDAAALAAVRQWRYTPALKNGQPVEVIITVTVSFSLR